MPAYRWTGPASVLPHVTDHAGRTVTVQPGDTFVADAFDHPFASPTDGQGRRAGKLGWNQADPPVGLHLLHEYLFGELPPAPESCDFTEGIEDWGMGGNDQVGDCTIVAGIHLDMAWSAKADKPYKFPTLPAIKKVYFGLTGGPDTGLVEHRVLSVWHREGLFGHKIAGYARVPHKDFDAACACFSGLYIGVRLPQIAMQQFESGEPWDLTDTPADDEYVGGHAVPVLGFDRDGATVITWARKQRVSRAWLDRNCMERWAVIGGENDAVDIERLQHDLSAL